MNKMRTTTKSAVFSIEVKKLTQWVDGGAIIRSIIECAIADYMVLWAFPTPDY
jgi:hypothetical protein